METVIGIDVAQDEVVVAQRPGGLLGRWPNDAAGWAALTTQLTPVAPRLIVLEGTGGLERGLAATLHAAGLPVAIANPRRARSFAISVGRLTKTDPIDAGVLAHYGEAAHLPARSQPTPTTRKLQALVVRRRQVRDLRTAETNRVRRAHPAVQDSLRRSIDALTAELATLDRAIAAAMAADPSHAQRAEVLRSAPGIGAVTAATLVAELPELGTLTAKEVASLIGVAPHQHQSGNARGTGAIQGGRGAVRAALYVAAVTATRCDPRIRAFYTQLCARGKPRKVALVASEHKLLTILNAMLRDGTRWHKESAVA